MYCDKVRLYHTRITMKKIKLIILSILCSILLITPYSKPIYAESEDYELKRITYIDNDSSDGNIIYEFNNNGIIYRITEYIENNYEKVTSYIEIKQNDGSYKLITKDQSILTENGIEISTFDYESSTINNYTYTIANESVTLKNNLDGQEISLLGSSSSWVYDGTAYGSNKIAKFTIAFVTQVLIGIALPGSGIPTAVASAAIGDIASRIIDKLIPTIYYSRAYYEKHALDVSWYMVTGSKWVTRFYENSDRTQFINSVTDIVYLDGYEE